MPIINTPTTYVESFSTSTNISALPPYGEINQIKKYISLNSTLQNNVGNGTVFTFDNNASNIDGYYNNSFISTSLGNYFIISYTGAIRSGAISTTFNNEPINSNVYIRTCILKNSYSVNPQTGSLAYVLQYSKDNFSPFIFSGSNNSQQQEVCYDVELKHLVIPNIVLKSDLGGRVAFYPFLFVQLATIPATTLGCLWSNNPNAIKMTFRVIVSDTNQPAISPFVRLRSDGIKQRIKIKPNDNFHFSIRVPDGELLINDSIEEFSPSLPNPMMQISALFSFDRVS